MIAVAHATCRRCADRFIVYRQIPVLEIVLLPELLPLAQVVVRREALDQMADHDTVCDPAPETVEWPA